MWHPLSKEQQLDALIQSSHQCPQVIFKHSTRCSISRVALSRFDRIQPPPGSADYFLLDLLAFRPLSQVITERFGITHESPQVLVIRNGSCQFHANHLDIEPDEVIAATQNA
jgi:bacillithiol system protein YtxJ